MYNKVDTHLALARTEFSRSRTRRPRCCGCGDAIDHRNDGGGITTTTATGKVEHVCEACDRKWSGLG